MKNLVKKVTMLILWLKNRRQFKKPKKINLSNILNYLDAEVQNWKNESGNCETYIKEQSIWRLSEVKKESPECLILTGYCTNCSTIGPANIICTKCNLGINSRAIGRRCVECGCDIYDLSFQRKGCEGSCFPKRMVKEEWEDFKKKNNIEIC